MSAWLLVLLPWLREWAADPGALIYICAPPQRPRFLVFRGDVAARDSDEQLCAYLRARID